MFACSVQYFCGSATPPLQSGGASALPNFGGFPYIYMYALCRRNTKFDAVTHMGNGLGFRGQPPLGPKGSEPQHCPISGVSSYLLVHSLKQNDQFGCGNTCGGRACFRQSSTPSIPRWHDRSVPHFCVFSTTYAYKCTFRSRTTKFSVITHMGRGVFCEVRHATAFAQMHRGLSVTAESLVKNTLRNTT